MNVTRVTQQTDNGDKDFSTKKKYSTRLADTLKKIINVFLLIRLISFIFFLSFSQIFHRCDSFFG